MRRIPTTSATNSQLPARDYHLNQANKLSRTYATLLEALNRHNVAGSTSKVGKRFPAPSTAVGLYAKLLVSCYDSGLREAANPDNPAG